MPLDIQPCRPEPSVGVRAGWLFATADLWQVGRDALGKPFTSAFDGWFVTVALLLISLTPLWPDYSGILRTWPT